MATTGKPSSLATWNDGAAKSQILDFVARVTEQGGPDFVPRQSASPPSTTMARFGASSRYYDALIIGYVSTFVPKQTGEQLSPHVSTGVATRDYLDEMLAEPFEPFTFSPAGAAVYQLGPFGTAAKKLKEWNLKP